MRIIQFSSILLLVFLLHFEAKSTNIDSSQSYLRNGIYRISFLNAGIGMPPNFINGRLQPGVEVNYSHALSKTNKRRNWDYSLGLGYFAQQSLQRVAYLKPNFGYSFRVYKSIFLRPSLNASFMLVRQTNDEFQFKNGNYEKVNRNRFQFMPSFGIESYFNIAKLKKVNCGGFLRYEFGTELPFSNLSAILPINQIHVGLTFKK